MSMDPYKKKLILEQPIDLVPVEEYTREGSLRGLVLPTGIKLMNVSPVSEATLQVYSDYLDAEKFTVKGKWVFVPDLESLTVDTFPKGVESERKKKK